MSDPRTTPAAIIQRLVDAMKRSKDEGCTDHLDCCEGGSAFWYDAIEEAEAFLKETSI